MKRRPVSLLGERIRICLLRSFISGRYCIQALGIAACVVFGLGGATVVRARESVGDPRRELARMAVRLADGMVGRQELAFIERMARGADPAMRQCWETLLARHEREYLCDPGAAIRRLAPLLLSGEQLVQWRKTDPGAGLKGRTRAGSEPPPAYPGSHTLKIVPELAGAACEAARAWRDLDYPERAMAIVDALGNRFSDWPRALAAECAGDILFQNSRTRQAIDSYRLAIGILEQMSRRTEGLDEEQSQVLARVRRSLSEAERRARIEQYGSGWYAYYEAEAYRRTDGDLLRALWAYDRVVREYPGTVYAEASRAYGIQVLFDLSRSAGLLRAQAVLQDLERAVREQRARVSAMRRAGVASRRVARDEGILGDLESQSRELRALPIGAAAEREAFARAEAFLAERPRGLYRGETLVDLARWKLEEKLDQKGAFEGWMRAWSWLEEAGRGETALDAFEVPREAAEVCRPPVSAVCADRMGNIQNARIEAGMVINRRTCSWYLDSLRTETALSLGFLSWLRKDGESAAKWYDMADKFDPRGRVLREQGWAGAGYRLRQALERGVLHASEEEARRYSGSQRLAVALAEFNYCADRPERVLGITDRLLSGQYGLIDQRKAQYVRLLRGLAQHARQDRASSIVELQEALRGPWTITQDRAAFALANALWGARRYEEAGRLLERLAGSGRLNPYVWRAQVALGLRLGEGGQCRSAIKWLERVPQRSAYHAFAEQQAAGFRELVERN